MRARVGWVQKARNAATTQGAQLALWKSSRKLTVESSGPENP